MCVCARFYCPYIMWTKHRRSTLPNIRVAYNNVNLTILDGSRRSSASAIYVTNNIHNFEKLI